MLNKERDSIMYAPAVAYERVRAAIATEYTRKQEVVRNDYRTDPRYLGLVKALKDVGVAHADEQAWNVAVKGVVFAFGTKSMPAEVGAAITAVPNDIPVTWRGSPAYTELNIALNTCTKKWPALQADVYLFVARLNTAKTVDDINECVRAFTRAIA